ncbi:MAG: hypothetical protein ACJ788_18250 [Ktedonobacteraceae bacterium]
MTRTVLIVLSCVALVSGLGWGVLSQQSVLVDIGIVALSLCLGWLSFRLEK